MQIEFQFANGTESQMRLSPQNARDKQLLLLFLRNNELAKIELRGNVDKEGALTIQAVDKEVAG